MKISTKRRIALSVGLLGIGLVVGTVVRQRYFPTAMMPSRFIQAGHDVDAVAFSANGAVLMANQNYGLGAVTLWSPKSERELPKIPRGTSKVWLSPDGRRSLNEKSDFKRQVTLCSLIDATNGKIIRKWEVAGSITAMSRDMKMFVSIEYVRPKTKIRQTVICINDVANGRVIGRYVAKNSLGSGIRFSWDSQYITVPSYDSPSLVLRVRDMKPVLPLPQLENLRLSRDSRRVIGISDDATLHVWQLPSGQHTKIRTGLTRGRWLYTNEQNLIVVNGEVGPRDRSQSLTEIRSPEGTQLLRTFSGGVEAASSSGNLLVTRINPLFKGYFFADPSNYDVWDIRSGNRLARLNVSSNPLGQADIDSDYQTRAVTFSPDDHEFVMGKRNGLISRYDLESKGSAPIGPISNDSGRTVLEFKQPISGANIMPDGSVAASGTSEEYNVYKIVDSEGNLKNVATNSLDSSRSFLSLGSIPYIHNNPYSYNVSLQGSKSSAILKVTGNVGQKNLLLSTWNPEKGTTVDRILASREKKIGKQLFVLAWAVPSPDNQKVVILWENAQRKKDDTAASTNQGTGLLEIIDIASGKLLQNLQVINGAQSTDTLANPIWSNDSTQIAMADTRNRVHLWDVASGKQIGLLSGTRPAPSSTPDFRMGLLPQLAFTPDKQFLAVGRDDGSIYLYSLRSFLPIAQIGKNKRQLAWLKFSPDGRTLYGIIWYDNKVLAWNIPNTD